jgi:hypothetical protein
MALPLLVPNCFLLHRLPIVQCTFRSISPIPRRVNPPKIPEKARPGLLPLRPGPSWWFQKLSQRIQHHTRLAILSMQLPPRIRMARLPCIHLQWDSTFIQMRNLVPPRNQCHGGKFRLATLIKQKRLLPHHHSHLCLKTRLPIRLLPLKCQLRPVRICRHQGARSPPQMALAIR